MESPLFVRAEDTVTVCTNCYLFLPECTCQFGTRRPTSMSKEKFERERDVVIGYGVDSDDECSPTCSSCECWWCDRRRLCNPCVQCSENEPCGFTQVDGCSPVYSTIEEEQEDSTTEINTFDTPTNKLIRDQEPEEESSSSEYSSRDPDVCHISPFKKTIPEHRLTVFLRSRNTVTVPAEVSMYVLTDVVIDKDEVEQSKKPSKRMKLEVTPVDEGWWLSDAAKSKLLIKSGHISPDFHGDLCVQVFNRTGVPVTIPGAAPIASLNLTDYDYSMW